MRAFILSWLLVIAGPGANPIASAQDDFDDEWDEEEEDTDEGDEDDLEDDLSEADEEDVEGDEEPEPAAPADEQAQRLVRLRLHNTFDGAAGGFHVVDAGSGPAGSFRVQLATEFSFVSNFLNEGDENDHIAGTLSVSWTALNYLEIFASIASSANANTTSNPELFQILGDSVLGVKGFYPVVPWFTLGGDLSLALLNTVGDIGLVLDSTSLGIRANATADFRQLRSPVPLIARLNLQYFLDNSAKLIEDVETQRFAALADPAMGDGITCPLGDPCPENETRHLLTRVERFALSINRVDFFNFGLGLEAPLRAANEFYINPILEWNLGVPINRQDYNCLFVESEPGSGEPIAGDDGCLDVQGFSSFPQTLTLGVRVLPPLKGLALYAGVDIGLTGTSTFVRELAGTAPYNILLGASYAYDTRPPPIPEPIVREVERRVEVQIPPPPKGRINGIVVEQGAGTPVAGAAIRFPGRDLTAMLTGDDGRFVSYELDPGEVQLEVTHTEYNPGSCAGVIAAEGGNVDVRCEIVALPRVGTVAGRVMGDDGSPLGAPIQITGPTSQTATADPTGSFSATGLIPGTYTARVEAEGYLIKLQQFDIAPRQTTNIEITLIARPRQPLVRLRRNDIQIRRQINFATDSAEILSTSFALMTEIADVVMRNPDLSRIEIQGHTDNRGGREYNQDLSQRRAESVRDWLLQNGVDASRLEARGYGMTRALVPNITPANRARNRRVQFIILERGEAAAPAE